jgi:V/A-type H+-transporting ATPase subunit I
MFGDIGQGLVIAILGFALRERYPIARLFIAGGVSAAVFGALFGSVFSLHLVDALWVNPLDRPLDVLLVPIVGGALLLGFGLLLAGLEAYWRRQLGEWLATDAALVVVYGGIVAGFLRPAAFAVAMVAAVAFCIARALHAKRVAAAATAVAQLVERTLQLLINTLSFARVGAFALAHAGLSSAIVALMDAAPTAVGKGAVLVAGNLLVILLETLVVSVQTTRLVLFEFFTRFLGATGRVFRPLPVPPSTT